MRHPFIAGLLALLLAAAPVEAITYGELDGGAHPNVGVILLGGALFCSNVLVAPRVAVTAAHCTAFLESVGVREVSLTFEPEFDPATSRVYRGRVHTHPAFFASGFDDPADVAVIVLDEPVAGVQPARLPEAGLLDRLALAPGKDGTGFTAVGYGSQQMQVGGGVWSFPSLGVRQRAVSGFLALTKGWLRLSQNRALGDGGTCYGDSGGPNFVGAGPAETDVVAGLTVTGDFPCFATNTAYRLDIETARAFLAQFVELP